MNEQPRQDDKLVYETLSLITELILGNKPLDKDAVDMLEYASSEFYYRVREINRIYELEEDQY